MLVSLFAIRDLEVWTFQRGVACCSMRIKERLAKGGQAGSRRTSFIKSSEEGHDKGSGASGMGAACEICDAFDGERF